VEGRCPWCAQWLSLLKPLLAGLGGRLDTRLSFVGLDRWSGPNAWRGFSSAHGPAEVAADAYELCAEAHYKEPAVGGSAGGAPLWVDFVECMDAKFAEAGPGTARVCAAQLGMDGGKLAACAVGAEGRALLDKSIASFHAHHIASAPSFLVGNGSLHAGVVPRARMLELLCPSLACLDADFKAQNPRAWRAEQALAKSLAGNRRSRAAATPRRLQAGGVRAPAHAARDPLLAPLALYAAVATLLLVLRRRPPGAAGP